MRRPDPRFRAVVVTAALLVGALLPTVPGAQGATGSPGPTGAGTNGTLSLSASPSTAKVDVNGTAVPLDSSGLGSLSLAPGSYVVTATAAGDTPFDGNVTIGAGQTSYLTIHLVPAAGPSGSGSSGSSIPVTVLATVVGAIVVVGLTVLALRRAQRPRKEPPRPPPPPASETDEGPV